MAFADCIAGRHCRIHPSRPRAPWCTGFVACRARMMRRPASKRPRSLGQVGLPNASQGPRKRRKVDLPGRGTILCEGGLVARLRARNSNAASNPARSPSPACSTQRKGMYAFAEEGLPTTNFCCKDGMVFRHKGLLDGAVIHSITEGAPMPSKSSCTKPSLFAESMPGKRSGQNIRPSWSSPPFFRHQRGSLSAPSRGPSVPVAIPRIVESTEPAKAVT